MIKGGAKILLSQSVNFRRRGGTIPLKMGLLQSEVGCAARENVYLASLILVGINSAIGGNIVLLRYQRIKSEIVEIQ
jgi:hypothetical protein